MTENPLFSHNAYFGWHNASIASIPFLMVYPINKEIHNSWLRESKNKWINLSNSHGFR